MIGQQSGLETVFSTHFGLLFMVALLFGLVFAWWVRRERRARRIPQRPGETAILTIIGVAITGFISGFEIGWENVVKLALLFVASGVPQMIETRMANDEADKAEIREQLHDTTKALAERS